MKKLIIITVVLIVVAAAVIGYLHFNLTNEIDQLAENKNSIEAEKEIFLQTLMSDFSKIIDLEEETSKEEYIQEKLEDYFSEKTISNPIIEITLREPIADETYDIYYNIFSGDISIQDLSFNKIISVVNDFEHSPILSDFQSLLINKDKDMVELNFKVNFYEPKYSYDETDQLVEIQPEEEIATNIPEMAATEAPKEKTKQEEISPKPKTKPKIKPKTSKKTITHVLKKGENLFRLSQRYGTSVQAIVNANSIRDVSDLSIGLRLTIPVGSYSKPKKYTPPKKKWTPPAIQKPKPKANPETFYVSKLDGASVAGIIFDESNPIGFLSVNNKVINVSRNDLWQKYVVLNIDMDKILLKDTKTNDLYYLLFNK